MGYDSDASMYMVYKLRTNQISCSKYLCVGCHGPESDRLAGEATVTHHVGRVL